MVLGVRTWAWWYRLVIPATLETYAGLESGWNRRWTQGHIGRLSETPISKQIYWRYNSGVEQWLAWVKVLGSISSIPNNLKHCYGFKDYFSIWNQTAVVEYSSHGEVASICSTFRFYYYYYFTFCCCYCHCVIFIWELYYSLSFWKKIIRYFLIWVSNATPFPGFQSKKSLSHPLPVSSLPCHSPT